MQKYYIMAIKQHLWKKCIKFTINIREILPIIFAAIQSTKHFVDWVFADYNGYLMQESGKSDKYGFFSGACLRNSR